MLLDMAVKQREAGLAGDQIYRYASKCGNNYRILLNAGSRLAVDFDKLEQVPVNVHRVRIVAAIVKHQPIAISPVQEEFPIMRILFAIDQPVIDAMR